MADGTTAKETARASAWSDRLARVADEEPPVQRAALAALLGAIAVKDLLINAVPFALVAGPGDLRLPFVRVPMLPPGEASAAIAFALHVVAFVCAIALAAGRWTRAAAAFLATLYAWTFLADQLTYTNNVFLFVVLLSLCALEPIDPHRPSPIYPTLAVRALVSVIYLVGALVKLRKGWLSGYVLGEALHHYHFAYQNILGFDLPFVFRLLAITTVLVEGFLAFGLWRRTTRRLAIVVGVSFHLTIELLLPVRMFSFLMPATFVLFVAPATIAPWVRARAERPVAAAALGVAAGLGVDLLFAWLLRVDEIAPRNALALALACVLFGAAWALSSERSTAPSRARAFVPRRLRVPLVVALAALEAFAAVKPAFGFTNRFGWRMFTEVLRMRATADVLHADGSWQRTKLDGRWSSGDLRYHWDSLGEQRAQLLDYADWLLAHDPSARAVRITLEYVRDGVSGTEVLERRR